MNEYFRLFPTCVMKTNLGRNFTNDEIGYFESFENYRENISNLTSDKTDVLSDKSMHEIGDFILENVASFAQETIKPKERIDLYLTQSWLNKTPKNMSHHSHWHQNSLFSGVFYVSAIEEHDRIYFTNPVPQPMIYIEPEEYTLDNSRTWFIPVKTGDLLVFPSFLTHHVATNNHDHERISLAFNAFAKGIFGSERQLNQLVLK